VAIEPTDQTRDGQRRTHPSLRRTPRRVQPSHTAACHAAGHHALARGQPTADSGTRDPRSDAADCACETAGGEALAGIDGGATAGGNSPLIAAPPPMDANPFGLVMVLGIGGVGRCDSLPTAGIPRWSIATEPPK